MSLDSIVDFYSGGIDHRGRTLDRILAWSDAELESVHDYIQWVFPTVQPSGVNPFAPLVTPDTIRTFETRPELRGRLRQALDRLLAFYGLRRETRAVVDTLAGPGGQGPQQTVEEPKADCPSTRGRSGARTRAGLRSAPGRPVLPRVLVVIDDARFPDRARNWLRPFNHNHLRLTRMMDSLSTLGLRDEARALQRCLVEDIYEGQGKGKISEETRDYWLDAVRD